MKESNNIIENNKSEIFNYINAIFDSFVELKGDRKSGDDDMVKAGLGLMDNEKFVAIIYKGDKDTNQIRLPSSEGYRKSLRLMNLAETFSKPLLVIIDIPEFHILPAPYQQRSDETLAKVQEKMLNLNVPIIAIITGFYNSVFSFELCAVDSILTFEHSIFIMPIHQKSDYNESSQPSLKQTKAQELMNANLVDKIIVSKPNSDMSLPNKEWKKAIQNEFQQIIQIDHKNLIEQRLNRLQDRFLNFRKIMSET